MACVLARDHDGGIDLDEPLISPTSGSASPAATHDVSFANVCAGEMNRVDAFYREMIDELEQSIDVMEDMCGRALQGCGCDDGGPSDVEVAAAASSGGEKKNLRSLRDALTDRYREINHLINFGILNNLAFVKAIKKARKVLLSLDVPSSVFLAVEAADSFCVIYVARKSEKYS